MSNPDDLDDGLLYSDSELTADSRESHDLKTRKRKSIDPESEKADTREVVEDTAHLSKRQKKLLGSKKLIDKRREQVRYDINLKKSISKSPVSKITEYFVTLIRKANPSLSPLELDEHYFKKTDFISTEAFENDRNLTNLPSFISRFSKSPKLIVLSMSNLRVADVYRSLGGGKHCLKLFAKNKLEIDLAAVEKIMNTSSPKTEIKRFIATPTRLHKIIESTNVLFEGKEKLDIILDSSYLDPKSNSLLSSDNVSVLCKLLKEFLNKKSSVKILLF